jgi:hypothetical protein
MRVGRKCVGPTGPNSILPVRFSIRQAANVTLSVQSVLGSGARMHCHRPLAGGDLGRATKTTVRLDKGRHVVNLPAGDQAADGLSPMNLPPGVYMVTLRAKNSLGASAYWQRLFSVLRR